MNAKKRHYEEAVGRRGNPEMVREAVKDWIATLSLAGDLVEFMFDKAMTELIFSNTKSTYMFGKFTRNEKT